MLLQLKQKKKLVFFLDSEFARTYPAIAKEDKNNDLAWWSHWSVINDI